MSDERVTNGQKARGRPKAHTEADARKAYELYFNQNCTGKEVAALMKRPRTTVLDMARSYAAMLGVAQKDKETGAPAST